MDKIKILALIDSPAVATGFGVVAKGIFKNLAERKYDIDIIGINDRGGWKDPKEHPYRIYPARIPLGQDDYYGRPRLIASLLGNDPDLKPPWDIVFTLQDPFILEQPLPIFKKGTMAVLKQIQATFKKKLPPKFWFKIVSYWPIDSPLKENWITDAIALPDYSIVYTKYGKEQVEKAMMAFRKDPASLKVQIIYHGVDTESFRPIAPKIVNKFKKSFFGNRLKDDTFLIVAVARNQLRKDLPRTMAVFKEFQKRRPDSFLYIHAKEQDAWGSLREYARNWKLELNRDWGVPANFSENVGYPAEVLNLIYNSADCILSTSLGEGFGNVNIEAFAARKLIVGPNNTTTPELFNYDKNEDISDINKIYHKLRGVPVKCFSTSSEWATYGPQDFERIRPLVNIDDAVKKLLWVYDNPDKAKKIAKKAYKWALKHDWKIIVNKWDALFRQAFERLEYERTKVTNDSTY